MTGTQAHEYAQKRFQELATKDFNQSVLFVTVDSVSFFENAFAESKEDHVFVFTEHHGFDFQHEDEVVSLRVFPRAYVEMK